MDFAYQGKLLILLQRGVDSDPSAFFLCPRELLYRNAGKVLSMDGRSLRAASMIFLVSRMFYGYTCFADFVLLWQNCDLNPVTVSILDSHGPVVVLS